jgi:hypothetical protein
LFRLAREIGRSVTEIESTMPPEEYREWIALFGVEAREREEAAMAARAQSDMQQRLARAGGR